MKNFTHSINVTHNSNYIISHSGCDWSPLRVNSLISIDNDMHFYTIGKVEELNLVVDFKVINGLLILNGNLDENFIIDDSVTLSYKEYELSAIKSIISSGQNYKVGDILSPEDGVASINVFDNSQSKTLIKVEDVGENGSIHKLSIINNGKYISIPKENTNLFGGNGNGATISTIYSTSVNRKMIDKQVISSYCENNGTVLELDSELPIEVTEGKLSLYKHRAFLTSNYIGETKKNCQYHVIRDVSPFLGLPLLLKNSNKNEESYNHTILKVDKIIHDLQVQIYNLNNK
jgi:hypothetical protein